MILKYDLVYLPSLNGMWLITSLTFSIGIVCFCASHFYEVDYYLKSPGRDMNFSNNNLNPCGQIQKYHWHQLYGLLTISLPGSNPNQVYRGVANSPPLFFRSPGCKILSELHKTFRIWCYWSPELIITICGHACACMQAQQINLCMPLFPLWILSPELAILKNGRNSFKIGHLTYLIHNYLIIRWAS